VAQAIGLGATSQVNTGCWVGPHVFDYAERIRVNGHTVSHDLIVEIYRRQVEPYLMDHPDQTTGEPLEFAAAGILLACLIFKKMNVGLAVFEVGAGGRYTPTMALPADACVLTNVGEDHLLTLGPYAWQRAAEKAGIARADTPFFSTERVLHAYVQATVKEKGGRMVPVEPVFDNHTPPMPGFILQNWHLAFAVVRYFFPSLEPRVFLKNQNQTLPGRFEVRESLIVDVAHNPNKIEALAQRLAACVPKRNIWALVGLTRKRDPLRVFSPLLPLIQGITVVPAGPFGQNPQEILHALKEYIPQCNAFSQEQEGFLWAKEKVASLEQGLLLVCGSGYLIDQLLNPNPYLKALNQLYGWRDQAPNA
jgi:dihydrofolate synthase/folylpolyglutamate synthase